MSLIQNITLNTSWYGVTAKEWAETSCSPSESWHSPVLVAATSGGQSVNCPLEGGLRVARVSIVLWKVASGWPDRPEGWTICILSNAGLHTFPYKHINIKNIATQALLNIILEYHRWTVLASDNRDYLKDEICIKVTFLFPCHLIYFKFNFSKLNGGGGAVSK